MTYDPASWAANRSAVGAAILGMTWSSALGGAAFALVADDPSDDAEAWAGLLATLSGVAGLMTLIALTVVGWRLAFVAGPPVPAPAQVPPPHRPPAPADGTPSVRVVDEGPPVRKAEPLVRILLGLGVVVGFVVVVLLLTSLA